MTYKQCSFVRAGLLAAAILGIGAKSIAQVASVGLNRDGQTTVPGGLSGVVAVGAGREFSLALRDDGSVVAWGENSDGKATPPPDLGAISISAGIYHTLSLKADGTIAGWGYNGNSILSIPPLSDVLAVAAGGYHSLTVKRDGTVVGWGFSGNGRTVPPPTLTDVVAIDAGRDHSLALKSDGTVVAWGLNDSGQTNVPPGLSGVIAISAGDNHNLALKADGNVVAWGLNAQGQCNVPGSLSGVVAIAAGSQHSLALKSDGTIVGWGSNANGEWNFSGNHYRGIAAGGFHSVALTGTGPLITGQPLSRTVLAGADVTFSVTATGSGLNYQWQFNGADIPGATAPGFTLPGAGRANAGVYTVRVSNAGGSVRSANAVLIVRGLQQLAAPVPVGDGALRLVFGDQHGDAISAPNLGRYQVQVSNDLETWEPLNQPPRLVNGRIQVDDPDAGHHPRRFYRVVEQ